MRTAKKKTLHRYAVIGYLAWRSGWVYPPDMLRSMAISSGSLYAMLDQLIDEAVVERDVDGTGRARYRLRRPW